MEIRRAKAQAKKGNHSIKAQGLRRRNRGFETGIAWDVRPIRTVATRGSECSRRARVVRGQFTSLTGSFVHDEISSLLFIQRYLLTAGKKYSIVGRNPHSAGASVKVEDVPCDFILIAASSINDLGQILPPLRSRIVETGMRFYWILICRTHLKTAETRSIHRAGNS